MRAPIEYLHAPFYASAGAAAEGEMYGATSISDALFESQTRIELGAFPLAVTEELPIEVWWRYRSPERIGSVRVLQESLEEALFLRARIGQTPRGQDALALLAAGVVEELRIGFTALTWRMVQQPDGSWLRHITALQVHQVELGTFALFERYMMGTARQPRSDLVPYQIISDEVVPAATRAIAEATLRCVSRDLGLQDLSAIRWIRPAEDDCTAHGEGEKVLWSTPTIRGAVRRVDERPVIYLRHDLSPVKQIVETVAHESQHIAQVMRSGELAFDPELRLSVEAEAWRYGREFAWEHPEFVSGVLSHLGR